MKNILTAIIFFMVFTTIANAQYSNYYNLNVNQKLNANINQNVNVNGMIFENKTITTIDYGALSLANAQRESVRLENIKYADEQQRRISLEIASDPVKAFDYGYAYNDIVKYKGKEIKMVGIKSYSFRFIVPNNAIFTNAGQGRFENVSSDGITTEIIFKGPSYNINKVDFNVEKLAQMNGVIVGQLAIDNINGDTIFVHKKETNRATVYGVKGFKYSMVWEDKYQNVITDNFASNDLTKGNGIYYSAVVRTYGNKNEVNFEKLEGRRFYFRRLVEKLISTYSIYDIKY